MENPISPKTRGRLYIVSIIVGGCVTLVSPIAIATGMSGDWAGVICTAMGVVTALTGVLARTNLDEPDLPGTAKRANGGTKNVV